MNMETNTVKYEYTEKSAGSEKSESHSVTSTDLEGQVSAQAEPGYLPTDTTGNDDVQFIEYSYFPQAEAFVENPEEPLALELLSSESFADFETQIAEQQDAGNDLIAVSYSDQTWNGYFGEATDDISYTSSDDPGEFINLINGELEEDLTLRSVEYGDGTWLATFDDSGSASAVLSEKNFDDLTGQITTQNSEGLDLIGLEYGDQTWVATFGDHPGASTYFTSEDLGVFQEEVTAQQEKGYYLVDVEYVGDAWYGVFNETLGTTEAVSNTPSIDVPTVDSSASLEAFQSDTVSSEIIDNFL
jgi:hypothetical protein